MTGPRRRRIVAGVLLAAVLLVAGWCRLTNLGGVFARPDRVFLAGLDSHYHLRRVQLTLERYPAVPTVDAWANAPEGATLDWPVGFDLTLASLCGLARWLAPGPLVVEAAAAFFGPLLGVLTCLLVFLLGRRLGGTPAGLLAALLAALLPMLSGYAMVGRVDHHAAEPILLLAPLLLLLRGLHRPHRPRAWAAAAGCALALGIAFWPGAIVVGAMTALALALESLVGQPLRACRLGAWCFTAAAALTIPLALLHPWAWQGRLLYTAPSWLQPLGFALAAAAFGLSLLLLRWRPDAARLERAAVLLVPAALALGALLLLSSDVRATLGWAAGYLGTSEAQISQVTESRPLLSGGLARALQQYTWLAPLAPALLVFAAWRGRRDPLTRVVALWLALALVLALVQLRLGSLLAPLWCALWGVALAALGTWLRRRAGDRPWLGPALLGLALTLLLLPTLALHRPIRFLGTAELVGTLDGLAWLRHRAASPGDPGRHLQPPRFTVLAPWQWGHWLTYLGGQANVANPLGQTPANLRGVRDSARFFLAEDPAPARALLQRRRARYVLVVPLLDQAEGLARHLPDVAPGRYLRRRGRKLQLRVAFRATMAARLLHYDGRRFRLQGRLHPPLRDLRLVYACRRKLRDGDTRTRACKIFERVPGARVEGRAPPGSRVELALDLAGSGLSFTYRDSATADARGRFALRVPYPTDGADSAEIRARGPYRLRRGGQFSALAVPLAAVRGGGRVRLDP